MMLIQTFYLLMQSSKQELVRLFKCGGDFDSLGNVLRHSLALAEQLQTCPQDLGIDLSCSRPNKRYDIMSEGKINLRYQGYRRNFDSSCDVMWLNEREGECESKTLFILLAVEGYAELIQFCRYQESTWESDIELKMIRAGALMGHTTVVDIFLMDTGTFQSTASDRIRAAILGAIEGKRLTEVRNYLGILAKSLKEPLLDIQFDLASHGDKSYKVNFQPPLDEEETWERIQWESALFAAMASFVQSNVTQDWNEFIELLKCVMQETQTEAIHVVRSLVLALSHCRRTNLQGITDLFRFLANEKNLKAIRMPREVEYICHCVMTNCSQNWGVRFDKTCEGSVGSERVKLLTHWLVLVSKSKSFLHSVEL
jgi:hypothetical protein